MEYNGRMEEHGCTWRDIGDMGDGELCEGSWILADLPASGPASGVPMPRTQLCSHLKKEKATCLSAYRGAPFINNDE